MLVKAVAYYRFSPRPNSEECDSIKVQQRKCRSYCDAHDYEIVGEYDDAELSGGRADNRPGLQAALEAACKHKAVLVTYSLSRFARNVDDTRCLIDRLHRSGADFASVTEGISTRGAIGKAFLTLLAVFAELERAQIVERTKAAMLYHQANGRRMSSRLPYGWREDEADTARMLPCPEEQDRIAFMRHERQAGKGYRVIAAEMNERGQFCRGKPWQFKTVARILARA